MKVIDLKLAKAIANAETVKQSAIDDLRKLAMHEMECTYSIVDRLGPQHPSVIRAQDATFTLTCLCMQCTEMYPRAPEFSSAMAHYLSGGKIF